jgi:hypothetical protein
MPALGGHPEGTSVTNAALDPGLRRGDGEGSDRLLLIVMLAPGGQPEKRRHGET